MISEPSCTLYGDVCTEEDEDAGGVLRHYCDQVLIAGATRHGPVDLNDFTMDGRPGWDCPHGVRADEFCRRCATCRIPGCGHVASQPRFAVTDMMIYPPTERTLHFCGLRCLDAWRAAAIGPTP